MTRNRPITVWLPALVALASALAIVVTAVRATRCARAAAIVEGASHESAHESVIVPEPPNAPADPLPAPFAPEADEGPRTCTNAFCPIPAHGHALPLAERAAPAALPALDDTPPRRPPAAIERPPRS